MASALKDEKFVEDLDSLASRLAVDVGDDVKNGLFELKNRLVDLHRENLVKINHSVMELVCARHLLLKGYTVDVEHALSVDLTCDLYAVKGYGSAVVEIETGFIPPEHALDPSKYLLARIASKIIRYSSHAEKFVLGVPPHYVLPFPRLFTVPPRARSHDDVESVKGLCDLYYRNPPVTVEEVRNAQVHAIYIIDVDKARVEEVDPEKYIQNCPMFSGAGSL